ncbi:uncharacterized protein LOC133188861 [Saccostrea echinata]|uniref:uncharacterized protein LOC133188861 n=1 Tax=Saccostrea echinata TaxID=191078 RepID=UPI002A840AC5|nr:uncharacterized protein LOC133188861 [Saccostrea echinata]
MVNSKNMTACLNQHFSKFLAAGIILCIPSIQIGVIHKMLWVPNKPPVNRSACRCNCFDTIFKGSYEQTHKTGYKHMYFNATPQMLVIWIMVLGSILVSYETLKHLWDLYQNRKLRWRMFILFVADVYPNYFSLWAYFNYINDGYYGQFVHQLFFTLTELFSTWNIILMCSTEAEVKSWRILCIIAISSIHIFLGGVDQFFKQLILLKENPSQRFRSLVLVVPDLLHVILPLQELALIRHSSCRNALTRTEIIKIILTVLTGFIIGNYILKEVQ